MDTRCAVGSRSRTCPVRNQKTGSSSLSSWRQTMPCPNQQRFHLTRKRRDGYFYHHNGIQNKLSNYGQISSANFFFLLKRKAGTVSSWSKREVRSFKRYSGVTPADLNLYRRFNFLMLTLFEQYPPWWRSRCYLIVRFVFFKHTMVRCIATVSQDVANDATRFLSPFHQNYHHISRRSFAIAD